MSRLLHDSLNRNRFKDKIMQHFKVLQRPQRVQLDARRCRVDAAPTRKARAARQVRSQVDYLLGFPKRNIHCAQTLSAWRRDVPAARHFCGALNLPERRIAPCDSWFAEDCTGGIISCAPGSGRGVARQRRPHFRLRPWSGPPPEGGKPRSGQDFYCSHLVSRR